MSFCESYIDISAYS